MSFKTLKYSTCRDDLVRVAKRRPDEAPGLFTLCRRTRVLGTWLQDWPRPALSCPLPSRVAWFVTWSGNHTSQYHDITTSTAINETALTTTHSRSSEWACLPEQQHWGPLKLFLVLQQPASSRTCLHLNKNMENHATCHNPNKCNVS